MSEHNEQGVGSATWTRRQAIRSAALALTGLSVAGLDPAVARLLHQETASRRQPDGGYEPRAFNPHEVATLGRLCELILPADDHSASARDAGAPEFIDLLAANNPVLARIFTSGMLWLDHEMRVRFGSSFLEAGEASQHELLALLAGHVTEPHGYESYEPAEEYAGFQDYETDAPAGLAPGVQFFAWTRRLTVDAFYTSPEGVRDVDYRGNTSATEYTVPDEAVRYALARSPFATGEG